MTIFAALAELEREYTLQRQREGIEAAKLKGQKFGRPQVQRPTEWNKVIKLWRQGEITAAEAMKRLQLKKATFYRMVKNY